MSYYFRDKPRFSDRLRSDNSGDDFMESLKRHFDHDSKTFFDPSPTSSRISRDRETPFDHRHTGFSRGFPFDDDGLDRRGIRSHLDDLAARHPEFADQLLGSPWGDEPFLTPTRNRRKGSGLGSYQGHQDDDTRSQASGSSAASAASGASGVSSHGEPEHVYSTSSQEPHINVQEQRKNTIPQYGLRNTVDIGQHRHKMDNSNEKMNRGQRSASAPPENRQTQQQNPQQNFESQQQPQNQNQRFVSRVDITPQQQHGDIPKRPMSPKQNLPQQTPPPQSQPQPQPTQHQRGQPQSNVRHIPIFVEGRDEPVIPKNVEETVFPQQQQRPQSPPQFHRPSHFNQRFANSRSHQQWPPQCQQFYAQQPHNEQHNFPQQAQKPNHYQQQQQQYRQQQAEKQRAQQQPQQQQQQQEVESESAPKPKQIQPKEPLERVALVQNEVDSLMEQVKLYSGNSRQDKNYMYLDEMLTRELIKLDDIETEGKPNVRQARKDAIKSIQDCIALLESKVPLPGQQEEKEQTEEPDKSCPSMETDVTPASSEQSEASHTAPIPLPPAPSTEQNLTNEKSVAVQEESSTVEPMPPQQACPVPLGETEPVTAMETQQDMEAQKRQAESSIPSSEPVESGSEQRLNVDNVSKAVKSPRKERKVTTPKPVYEQPIPLPAPEVCHT